MSTGVSMMAVEIEWCYHAYTILKRGGEVLAIDPHDGGSIGLETCRIEADYILVTHNHFDHNAVDVARGPRTKKVLTTHYGEARLGPFTVKGLKVFHDKAKGKLRGEVAAYRIDVEGLSIVHLGDLGHLIGADEYPELAGVHVMLIPVGGTFTINHIEAWKVVEELKPKIAIPIHYWMPGSHLPLDPLDRFLEVVRTGRKPVEGRRIVLEKGSLPEKTTIYYFT